MLRTVPASQAKYNFGELLRRVYELGEIQIIERAGIPVVGVVSIRDLERLFPQSVQTLPRLDAEIERERAARRLAELMTSMQAGNEKYSAEEVEADVQNAVNQVRYGIPEK